MTECIPDTSYLSSPDFIITTFHAFTFLEIPIITFGAYCILFKTPATMSPVKWLMLNLHFWSTLSDLILCFFGCPYILLPAPAGYSLGLIYAPRVLIYLCVTFLAALTASVLAIYENRYFVMLGHKNYWKRVRSPVLFLIYTYVPLIFLPAVLNIPDQETARPLILSSIPCQPPFTYSNRELFVLSLDYQLPMMCVFIGCVVLATPIITFATLMYDHLIRAQIGKSNSVKTNSIQKKFLVGLTIQSAFLLSCVLAPVVTLIIIIKYWYHNQSLNNFIFLILSFHGVGSTIVMVLVHRPYREFTVSQLKKLLKIKIRNCEMTCQPDISYWSSPNFIIDFLFFQRCFEIPLIIYGAYCILFKTPKEMGHVKWQMLNLHLWTATYSVLLTCLLIPYLVLPAMAGYGLGFIDSSGFFLYCTVTSLAGTATSILAIYENRYYNLFARFTFWSRVRKPILFFIYLLAPFMFLPPFLMIPEQEHAREVVHQWLPCLPEFTYNHHEMYVLSIELTTPFICAAIGVGALGSIIATFFVLTVKNLLVIGMRTPTSPRLYKMQRSFGVAITIQSVFMIIALLIPCLSCLLVILFWYHNQTVNNVIFLTISTHGLGSTLVMILVHKSYRKAVMELIRFECCRKTSLVSAKKSNVCLVMTG